MLYGKKVACCGFRAMVSALAAPPVRAHAALVDCSHSLGVYINSVQQALMCLHGALLDVLWLPFSI